MQGNILNFISIKQEAKMLVFANFKNGKAVMLCTLQKQLKAFLLPEECLAHCSVSGSGAGFYQAGSWNSASLLPTHSSPLCPSPILEEQVPLP